MNLKQFYLLLTFVFISVSGLAYGWEFWIEDLFSNVASFAYDAESSEERWEYVYSIAIFVFISMIIPFLVGKRLILRQEILTNELINLSETDALTAVYNRRKLNTLLNMEINRCKRYGHSLSIILIDIDCFKETNDRFGHIKGDETLVEMTEILKSEVRDSDFIGRWGGEEFLIICPETDIHGANTLAEKLRKEISEHIFNTVGYKTASFGVTSFKQDISIESFIQRADKALYTAKSSGRNKVKTIY